MPYVINAIIKANLAAPPHRVIDGFCKLVEARHIGQLTSNDIRKVVEAAEALMTDTRAVAVRIGLSASQSALPIGKLDVRCVLHVLKLGKVGEGRTFNSISEIAQVSVSIACMTYSVHAIYI